MNQIDQFDILGMIDKIPKPQMHVTLFVMGQKEPKTLPANQKVEINKYLLRYRPACELRPGDEFLHNGAWYLVEKVLFP